MINDAVSSVQLRAPAPRCCTLHQAKYIKKPNQEQVGEQRPTGKESGANDQSKSGNTIEKSIVQPFTSQTPVARWKQTKYERQQNLTATLQEHKCTQSVVDL